MIENCKGNMWVRTGCKKCHDCLEEIKAIENMNKEICKMEKPQRIFNCDSGWSIDLDMITYIGIPENSDTKVTLKIGMDSNVSKGNKDLFIIHEEDFTNIAGDVFSLCKHYIKTIVCKEKVLEAKEEDRKDRKQGKNLAMTHYQFLVRRIEKGANCIVSLYIEYEFKQFHSALKSAWNEWVNYKESLR